MKIAFRADASLQIGSGHIMRCLTLAGALRNRGAECHFLCREHAGHLVELVRSSGYSVHVLPCEEKGVADNSSRLAHAAWLSATQEQDVRVCRPVLQMLRPDWLIVDHYALDIRWEDALRSCYRRLMVIDDLADRSHQCDLLLDQNLGRQPDDYATLTPVGCSMLVGPQYALLRPEFASLRAYSLRRRKQPKLKNLLITMGGVDQSNATGKVLNVLKRCLLPDDCSITVVMGAKAPWLEHVQAVAAEMPWSTRVLVNVRDMAQLMADCDFAIGAAGSTSWERCCMGVPTLIVVLAENQVSIGHALELYGAAIVIGFPNDIGFEGKFSAMLLELVQNDDRLHAAINAAASITDGTGSDKVVRRLYGYNDSL